ncbi:MAG: sugar ABC transporter permease [Chloroflexota bacterium]
MSELTAESAPHVLPNVPKSRSFRERIAKYRESYLWLIPTFALLFTFNYYPAGSALYHSFFLWNGANLKKFIGIGHFQLMWNDPKLWDSFGHMLILTVALIIINLTFPLLAAALIFHLKDLKSAYIYRVLLVVPMVVPGLVILMIWKFIYSPNIGLLNQLLALVGLEVLQRPWLGDFQLALYAIIFVGFPWIAGIGTLIYLAGFQSIPTELLDSASIDGASTRQSFWLIEIPMVLSQIKLVLILTIISAFQNFTNILVMTNGGPGTETMVPGLYLYRNAMTYNKMGYACAIGTLLFVLTLALTYMNNRYMQSSVEFTGA